MSLEKLLEKIHTDGEKKAAEIISAAEKKAAEILSIAKVKKEAAKKEIIAKESAKIEQDMKGKRALLQIEARKNLLARKQEILKIIYQKAAAEIVSLPGALYQDFIEKRLVALLEKGEYEITVATNDRKKITTDFIESLNWKLKKKEVSLKFVAFSPSIEHGFILRQSNIEINSSLDEIIKSKRDILDIKLGKFLFEK